MATTRREFLGGSAAALLGSALARPELAWAWQRQIAAVFTPIRNGVGFFTGRGGTIGYLLNGSGGVVVDSQYPDSARICLDGLTERSANTAVDYLLNTHHHFDHSDGNIVFKGIARHVVSHERAAVLMRNPPGRSMSNDERLFPDVTFSDTWREQVGDEWIRARHYGPAHTGGDAIVTFENANVAHMGDLMWNLRHPVIDRPAGASIANWAAVLERALGDHTVETVYIFGHAGGGHPVTGSREHVLYFRDYLTALLEFVQQQITAGRTQTQIEAIREPLPRFPNHGPLTAAVLANAYGELTEG